MRPNDPGLALNTVPCPVTFPLSWKGSSEFEDLALERLALVLKLGFMQNIVSQKAQFQAGYLCDSRIVQHTFS